MYKTTNRLLFWYSAFLAQRIDSESGDLRVVDSVVAFHQYRVGNRTPQETIVPGYYVKELTQRSGYRRIGVEPIPKEKQPEVAKSLKKAGCFEPFSFW